MRVFPILFAVVLSAPVAWAESPAQTGHSMAAADATSEASAALEAVTAQMHMSMAVPLSGDPDVDFIRSMIPHHQGAVDMAQVVLEHGSDPDVRAMAEGVIAAQQAEIDWMRDWLATHGN